MFCATQMSEYVITTVSSEVWNLQLENYSKQTMDILLKSVSTEEKQ